MLNNPLISIPVDSSLFRGFADLEQTQVGLLPHRLPAAARAQFADQQLALVETEPSGVRLEFRSDATIIELDVMPTRRRIAGVPPRPAGVYDLCVDGNLERQVSAEEATILTTDLSSGETTHLPSPIQTLRFDGLAKGDKLVEVWLPYNEVTEIRALRANASVRPNVDNNKLRWLHHGSSISQGSNANSTTGIWPVIAARATKMDLTNMGFSGSALLDPFTARAIKNRPADIISVKLGINLANLDLMRSRAFGPAVHGFLDTIRDGHPDTPLLVISPIYCPLHEATPGPATFDLTALSEGRIQFVATGNPEEVRAGKLTLPIMRQLLQEIIETRSRDDKNIYYLDGLNLYSEQDRANWPLPDGLHPSGEIHAVIAGRFIPILEEIGENIRWL